MLPPCFGPFCCGHDVNPLCCRGRRLFPPLFEGNVHFLLLFSRAMELKRSFNLFFFRQNSSPQKQGIRFPAVNVKTLHPSLAREGQ